MATIEPPVAACLRLLSLRRLLPGRCQIGRIEVVFASNADQGE